MFAVLTVPLPSWDPALNAGQRVTWVSLLLLRKLVAPASFSPKWLKIKLVA